MQKKIREKGTWCDLTSSFPVSFPMSSSSAFRNELKGVDAVML
jgi:hypothetical protein